MNCLNPLATLDAYSASVSLLDGRTVDAGDIRFDQSSYHFYYNGVDVTNSLTQNVKAANFPKFDRARDNLRAYEESYTARMGKPPPATGDTSLMSNFVKQITTDPIAAPLESFDRAVEKVKQSTGIQAVGTIVGIGLIIWLVKSLKS